MTNGGGWGKWVYQCFLDELIGDTKPISTCTCASLYGQLVAIGGNHGSSGSKTPINAYNADKDSWYEIGKLASGRSQPLVAQLSEGTMVVVGGEHHIGGLLRSLLIFCD